MGCASSFVTLPSIVQMKTVEEKSDQLPPLIIPRAKSRKKNRLENFEPFTLIYLDEDVDENDQELRSIINYLRCFDDIETCEEFIQINNNQYDYLFFIVSYRYATNIISHIHDSSQIIAIYILQHDEGFIDQKWSKQYPKVKGIYENRDGLLDELSSDVKTYQTIGDLLPITVYSQLNHLQTDTSSTDHLRFLFYQLFIREYCLNSSSLTKTDLLNIMEDYYPDEIEQFTTKYHPTKGIFKWFLRETFLQRLLTKSLLTLNLKILFALRFFIKDMFRTMNDLGELTTNSREIVYYRSQILSAETFGRIKSNLGELLSINHFFLASQNRTNSLGLIRQYRSSNNSIHRILFEITIPSDYQFHKQRPFIELPSENDSILFFIGSIFRIDTVVFDMNNDCWIIQMTVYDERINEDFSPLFTFLNAHSSSITLANLLRQISPKSAEDFYEHLLKENAESFSKLQCYRGLGLCSFSRENYGQALFYFEKAMEMKSNDQSIKSSLHNSIGLVYAQQDEIDQAYIHFSEALKDSSSPLHTACAHHNLALISSRKGLYDEELDHYEQAFQIRTDQLPANHLQMASLYNNIGIAHSDMHQYDQALSNLRKALEMRLKLLPETHIDVARSYANIGAVYARTQELHLALEYFMKAQLLFEKQPNIVEQDLKQLNRNIKIVNDKLRRKTC